MRAAQADRQATHSQPLFPRGSDVSRGLVDPLNKLLSGGVRSTGMVSGDRDRFGR
jgi:hypothetical protein